MAHRILTSSQPAVTQLDALIKQMETTLGKSHSQSPFTGLYAQYGFSTTPAQVLEEETKQAAPVEEVKTGTNNDEKKAPVEKKQKAPKEAQK